MDLKLAAFSGKSEDFPAWSTKFVALKHTKGLFRTVMGNDDLPEAEPTLPEIRMLISRIPRCRSEQC